MEPPADYLSTETLNELLSSGKAKNPRWATCCHECHEGAIDIADHASAVRWREEHMRQRGESHVVSIGVEFELPSGPRTGWLLD